MLSTFSATSWAILAIDRRIRSASIRTLPLSVISPPTAFYSNRLLPQLTHNMRPIHPNSNRVARSPPARLSFSPVCPPGPPVCSHLHAAQHAKPAPCLSRNQEQQRPSGAKQWGRKGQARIAASWPGADDQTVLFRQSRGTREKRSRMPVRTQTQQDKIQNRHPAGIIHGGILPGGSLGNHLPQSHLICSRPFRGRHLPRHPVHSAKPPLQKTRTPYHSEVARPVLRRHTTLITPEHLQTLPGDQFIILRSRKKSIERLRGRSTAQGPMKDTALRHSKSGGLYDALRRHPGDRLRIRQRENARSTYPLKTTRSQAVTYRHRACAPGKETSSAANNAASSATVSAPRKSRH